MKFAARLKNLSACARLCEGDPRYVVIALLVGRALRRQELASLNIEDIQLREGRRVIIDPLR
jgi:integrase